MFVLGNLINPAACSREEAELMAAAAKVRAALEPLSEDEADFMAEHQAEIALMVDGASQSLGLSTDMLGNGLKQIDGTLRDIEYLHQREFATHGHLQSQQFFTSRQQLYRQLNNQLKATFLGKQLGLGSGSAAVPLASHLAAAPICAAIGLGSGGIGGVVCVLVATGAASVAGGAGGQTGGEWMGDFLYEQTRP
ncbi:hypothetical protein [Stutzerimonas stutzeri]|uniref:Uncharacterized protein n=1 Tax=Stutzerimonas stutzeri KOS6 TaxID=1218352 RepID=A0A061JS21_STUST|nr:hypothetical protein [Stutzerimonas stutzeri]EWC41398.1 hypothetical protein B597_010725 [Stutzerimonas stutzeri KOS6]